MRDQENKKTHKNDINKSTQQNKNSNKATNKWKNKRSTK